MLALAENPRVNALELAHTHIRFELGPHTFAATLFGDKHGYDWSTSQLSDAQKCDGYKRLLGAVLSGLNVGEALTYDATENNAVIHDRRSLGTNRSLGVHNYWTALGMPAEGVTLGMGDAGFQSPAGCFSFVASRYNSFDSRTFEPVKAHKGRWSLVRKRGVHRKHESVCHAVLERLGVGTPHEAKDVWVKILWGIRPEDFPHPLVDSEHADTNNWLWWYIDKKGWSSGSRVKGNVAYFNLAMIAKAQLIERGVPEHQIDLKDAYLPHTGVYKDGRRGQPRNLVVIKRLQ